MPKKRTQLGGHPLSVAAFAERVTWMSRAGMCASARHIFRALRDDIKAPPHHKLPKDVQSAVHTAARALRRCRRS